MLSKDGRTLWSKEEPEVLDRCRRPRSDFFLAQRVTFPTALPAGEYVLKLFVEDRVSSRATEARHVFVLSEPGSVAAKDRS